MFTEYEDFEPLKRNVTIHAGTGHFHLPINIIDNENLEDNKFFRISIDPPEIPTGHTACSTGVIIVDDDGKLLINVECLYLYIKP